MKFKAYNKDNATNTRPRGCTIHFREDGAIFLSKEFVVIKEIEQGGENATK